MKKKKLGVALVHLVCPVCGAPVKENIVINTKLTASLAKKVEDMNDKVVGYADHVCETCKEEMKLGIKIVEIDDEASEETVIPVRTGRYVIVKEETIKNMLEDEELRDQILERRYGFADRESFEALFGYVFNEEKKD